MNQFATLPAAGTCGGIIVAFSQDEYSMTQIGIRAYSVTVLITQRVDNEQWTLTAVYGPQGDNDKLIFIDELKQSVSDRWLLLGDFNLIYRMCDKNNGRVNQRLMNGFRCPLNDIEVKELHLNGQKYTWTSGTATPTQTKIDHVLATRDWELLFPHCQLQAGSTSISDHCPMVLSFDPFHRKYRGFRFEAYWLHMPEVWDIVTQSWSAPISGSNKARILQIKLARLAKALKRWNRQRDREANHEYKAAQELILRLDQLQDHRQLTSMEQ
jgi:hypothetical protein